MFNLDTKTTCVFLFPFRSFFYLSHSRWNTLLQLLSNRETVFLWFYRRVPEAGREMRAQWMYCGACQPLSACPQLSRSYEDDPSVKSHSAAGRHLGVMERAEDSRASSQATLASKQWTKSQRKVRMSDETARLPTTGPDQHVPWRRKPLLCTLLFLEVESQVA